MVKKDNIDVKMPIEIDEDSSKKESVKQSIDKKETAVGRNKEQRVWILSFLCFFSPFCVHSSFLDTALVTMQKEYYEREMEKRFVRTSPLGKDRNYNRYWWFQRDGRIFVESSDSKQWGYYSCNEEVLLN